jgi:superfamily II DNA/RNA helicase
MMVCRPDVEKLLRNLPPKSTRQNVMFSATYPENIKELAGTALQSRYELIDTVGEEETHAAEMVSL